MDCGQDANADQSDRSGYCPRIAGSLGCYCLSSNHQLQLSNTRNRSGLMGCDKFLAEAWLVGDDVGSETDSAEKKGFRWCGMFFIPFFIQHWHRWWPSLRAMVTFHVGHGLTSPRTGDRSEKPSPDAGGLYSAESLAISFRIVSNSTLRILRLPNATWVR